MIRPRLEGGQADTPGFPTSEVKPVSNEITVGHSEEYSSNVNLLSQQMDSRFQSAVTFENKTGKSAQFMNQVGAVTAQKRTTRHGDTPLIETPHDSRWVFPVDYEWADLIDKQDERGVRGIVDFESAYVRNGTVAQLRAMDDEVHNAFFSDTTKTGEDHGTTTTWTSFVASNPGHRIAHGSSGLTAAKIKAAVKALRAANVDLRMESPYCAVSSEDIEDLQLEDQYINWDYSDQRALNGSAADIKPFLGVRFIHYEPVNEGAPTTRSVPLWVPSGMGLAQFDGISARVSERGDKSYSTQTYTCGTFGATRLEEKKIVEVQCQ